MPDETHSIAADSASSRVAADEGTPDFYWTAPEEFLSLGVEFTDEQREDHLVEFAEKLWPSGTLEQQDQFIAWYRDVAAAAGDDGAAYSGVCFLAMEDDRVSTASLTMRGEPADTSDAEFSVKALVEALSNDEMQEVHRVESKCGPAVLAISGFRVGPAGGPSDEPSGAAPPPVSPVMFARADVYFPLPQVSLLLVFSLTTPSLPDLPMYVSRFAEIIDTIEVAETSSPDLAPSPSPTKTTAANSQARPSKTSPLYNYFS
ncbi:MAG: hypothetical protein ACRD1T_04370 [Acidimicrobiia bacterium]